MKIVKGNDGKIYYVQASHLSMVLESEYVEFTNDDGELKKATEIWIYGCVHTINATLDSAISQLGIQP